MNPTAPDPPVLLKIREAILAGEWMPGHRLAPAALAARFEASTTVIRESLIRLVGDRLVQSRQNHGFSIPQLDVREFGDLTELRCATESVALRLSVERGDLDWETAVLAAHHRLTRIPRRLASDPQRINPDWAAAHRDFHLALISACQCEPMLRIAHSLSLATDLYRRWAAPSKRASSRNVESEHEALKDAALSRDAKRAVELLKDHYEQTAAVFVESGLDMTPMK